eukprot:TRINITY_DN11971_c0_g1_i1.p1 TRINITY_DN11971_c0_g1~~TRINITY_DN11971_c0_g1_i1.p1  ORF type:complete len:412 (-),score=74.54 TRINITY_DN11971_c0_g1_i1:281-1516(-)
MLLLNLLDHPNILSYRESFTHVQEIWLIFDFLECGSMERIVEKLFSEGIRDEILIATILREVLLGIQYLHQNQQIHRDIKAANILIGADGNVCLSDFGLAAKLKYGKKRSSFVGSPCWMAPEVLDQEGKEGYDYKADIWSLGITAIELAKGKPPYYDCPAMKVILKTLNEEPPCLDETEGWDASFIEFVKLCLLKEPSQRKSAGELLKTKFIQKAKGKDYVKKKIVNIAGSLEQRIEPKIAEIAKSLSTTEESAAVKSTDKKSQKTIWDFSEGTIAESGSNKNIDENLDKLDIKRVSTHSYKNLGQFTRGSLPSDTDSRDGGGRASLALSKFNSQAVNNLEESHPALFTDNILPTTLTQSSSNNGHHDYTSTNVVNAVKRWGHTDFLRNLSGDSCDGNADFFKHLGEDEGA